MASFRTAFRARVASLRDDARGAAVMEFAIVAIPLIALIIAILQTSLVFFAQQALDTSSEKAVRSLVTGAAQKANLTADQFKTQACSKLPVLFKCANLMIDVRVATQFASVDTSTPAITHDSAGKPSNLVYNPGNASQITVVRMMYVWTAVGGPLGFDLSNIGRGKRLMISTQVFKTEPY